MGNGEFVYPYTDREKAVILDQLGMIHKLVANGGRSADYVVKALQSVINYDVVNLRPRKEPLRGGGESYLVRGFFCTFADARRHSYYTDVALDQDAEQDLESFFDRERRPVDEHVEIRNSPEFARQLIDSLPADRPRTVRVLSGLPLVDPIAALVFGAQFLGDPVHDRVTTAWLYGDHLYSLSMWCKTNGDRAMRVKSINRDSDLGSNFLIQTTRG